MKSEKYLQYAAMLMVVLIVNIPLSVHASISSVSVKGSKGIGGFVNADDHIDFSVSLGMGNVTINPNQVFLGQNIQFNSCSPSPSGHICTLRYPSSGTAQFSGPFPYTINLFTDSNKTQLDSSSTGNVLIDNLPPQVQASSSKNLFSLTDDVKIDYQITESACTGGACANKCSGVKTIELFDANNNSIDSVTSNSSDCSLSGFFTVDPATLNNGANKLMVRATDNFDQTSADSPMTVTVDSVPPSIDVNSFVILRKGVSINSYSRQPVPVTVQVKISARDLNLNSVIADLRPLNPAAKDIKGSCASIGGGLSTCTWNINLNPGTAPNLITGAPTATTTTGGSGTGTPPGSNSITINASDTAGNTESVTIPKSLSLDDSGPTVLSLETSTVKNGISYGKAAGNTVIAALGEQTGLVKEDIRLLTNSLLLTPSSCVEQINWVCTWNNVAFSSSDKEIISISANSVDLLLNPVTQSKTTEVIIDALPPVVTGVELQPIGTLSDAAPDLFKIGDQIAVVVNVTEKNELTGFADFSKYITGAKSVPGTCQILQNDRQQCAWLTDPIDISASASIVFNFTDPAGNELIETEPLKTLGLDTTPAPDFWNSQVQCSPTAVDRQLGPFVEQRVYCEVSLSPKKPGVQTVAINPARCSGGTNIIKSYSTFNNVFGSTGPIIKFTLKKGDLKTNAISLDCELDIFTRDGNRITANPETEKQKIDINFYNMPLGELEAGVQEKINEAKEDIKGVGELIGAINKIFDFLEKICQLYGMVYRVLSAYYTGVLVFKGATEVACKSVLGLTVCPALQTSSAAMCQGEQSSRNTAQKGWENVGNKFCKFVNCQWSPGVLGDLRGWSETQLNKLPLTDYLPGADPRFLPGNDFQVPAVPGAEDSDEDSEGSNEGQLANELNGGVTQYMDPKNNMLVAVAFGCIPGIVQGLENYRQIQCLYADCLVNAVGKDGLPVTACENLKSHAKCKYWSGELFALIPHAAFIDHISGLVKNALSNPFAAGGASITALCYFTCPDINTVAYKTCEGVKIASTFGEVLGSVTSIVKEGFKPRQDYCSRLDLEEETEEQTPEEEPAPPNK